MAADIFISFASKDVKVALTLCSAIESRGFKCWISARDIQPGENFQVAIVRALRNAKILLLVFTANSNASEEMTKELALASQQKMIVIPLRVEDVAPSDAFAYEFATRQWIDVFADWEFSIEQLCRRIEHALSVHSIEAGGPASTALDHAEAEALAAAAAELAAGPEPVVEPPVAKVEPAPSPPPEPARAVRKPEPVAAPTPAVEKAPAEKDPARHSGRIALVAVIIALAAMLALAIPMQTKKQGATPVAAEDAQPAAAVGATAPVAPDPVAEAAAAKAAEDAFVAEKAAAEQAQKAAAQRRAKPTEKKSNAIDIPF